MKEFLSHYNIPYTEHDIERDQQKIEDLNKLTGKNIVPTIIINDEIFIGFSQNREKIETLLRGLNLFLIKIEIYRALKTIS